MYATYVTTGVGCPLNVLRRPTGAFPTSRSCLRGVRRPPRREVAASGLNRTPGVEASKLRPTTSARNARSEETYCVRARRRGGCSTTGSVGKCRPRTRWRRATRRRVSPRPESAVAVRAGCPRARRDRGAAGAGIGEVAGAAARFFEGLGRRVDAVEGLGAALGHRRRRRRPADAARWDPGRSSVLPGRVSRLSLRRFFHARDAVGEKKRGSTSWEAPVVGLQQAHQLASGLLRATGIARTTSNRARPCL